MRPLPCAASSLLAGLLDGPHPLVEVVRTPLSVHYDTGRTDVPVLCVALPAAVRLPGSAVVDRLPTAPPALRPTRWWTPPRPRALVAEVRPLDLDPAALVGRGPGLTPSGDDVLAGALVAAAAVDHPDLPALRASVRAALAARRTTAVSRALLHHALDGWATPELAAYVTGVCAGDPGASYARLLAVGSSSGTALADGVAHVLVAATTGRTAA